MSKKIECADGTITELDDGTWVLPDGSACSTMGMPLPDDHWLTADPQGFEPPPMPFRLGIDDPRHGEIVEAIWAAAKYAVRGATMNGQDKGFDPDALCQNMVVGLIGYHTPDGLSSADDWDNPDPIPERLPAFAGAAE